MSHSTIVAASKSCAFVIQIQEPTETLLKLAMFFQGRHIVIEELHLHRYRSVGATVIILCQVEKDRIMRTVQLLERLPGVMELERMEGK